MLDTRIAVVAAAGLSAGIHLVLSAVHADDLPRYAAAYLTAGVALALVGIAVATRARTTRPAAAATALFAALLVSYAIWRHEPLDAIAAVANATEAVGLVASVRLLRLPEGAFDRGATVGVFILCVAAGLMVAGGHGHG